MFHVALSTAALGSTKGSIRYNKKKCPLKDDELIWHYTRLYFYIYQKKRHISAASESPNAPTIHSGWMRDKCHMPSYCPMCPGEFHPVHLPNFCQWHRQSTVEVTKHSKPALQPPCSSHPLWAVAWLQHEYWALPAKLTHQREALSFHLTHA